MFIKYFCLALLSGTIFLQAACGSRENTASNGEKSNAEKVLETLTKPVFPSPLEADYESELTEAKNLFDDGITFENTKSAHGMKTEKGISFGSNDFESSDDVNLSRYGKLYESKDELDKAFDAALRETKIFEKKEFSSGEKMFIGAAGDSAYIVNTSGNYLYRTSSPSLRHLLAFEMKEAHYFSYKSAK